MEKRAKILLIIVRVTKEAFPGCSH